MGKNSWGEPCAGIHAFRLRHDPTDPGAFVLLAPLVLSFEDSAANLASPARRRNPQHFHRTAD